MNLGPITHYVMVITPILPLFTTFGRKGWLNIDMKTLLLKGGRRILKSFSSFFSDARYKFYESRSNSYGYYPYFILFNILGMKGWRKINTNAFVGFRNC